MEPHLLLICVNIRHERKAGELNRSGFFFDFGGPGAILPVALSLAQGLFSSHPRSEIHERIDQPPLLEHEDQDRDPDAGDFCRALLSDSRTALWAGG
jgi:hypothetical protein